MQSDQLECSCLAEHTGKSRKRKGLWTPLQAIMVHDRNKSDTMSTVETTGPDGASSSSGISIRGATHAIVNRVRDLAHVVQRTIELPNTTKVAGRFLFTATIGQMRQPPGMSIPSSPSSMPPVLEESNQQRVCSFDKMFVEKWGLNIDATNFCDLCPQSTN